MILRFILVITVMLAGHCFIACDQGTIHVVRLPNGKVKEMWVEKSLDGTPSVREGTFQSFFADGARECSIEYKGGKKNGAAHYWTPAGRLYFQGEYKDEFMVHETRFDEAGKTVIDRNYSVHSNSMRALGPEGDSINAVETCAYLEEIGKSPLRHGLCRLVYADGKTLSTRFYQVGHLQGPVKAWYPDGKSWMEGVYDKDIPTGAWRTWSASGTPLWSATYAKGEKEGVTQEWFPDGKAKAKSMFHSGKQEGPYQEWYPNGKTRLTGLFQAGRKEGSETAWYPDGARLYSARYIAGALDGDFFQWYPGGHMRLHCRFTAGKKEGLSRVFHRQGTVLEQAYYKDGKLNGPYRTWTADGKLVAEKEFKEGTVAFDSKAKALLELLGADQVRVPVGLLGFYWGMEAKDCRTNLALAQASDIHANSEEMTGNFIAFADKHPTQAKVRLRFNAQGELWGIKLDLLQKNSGEFFPLCENLETEIGSTLGVAGYKKGEGDSPYFLTRKKDWGRFSVTSGAKPPISRNLPVVSAEGFSPGNQGWFHFSLSNHLYREYANPTNASITPPEWPAEPLLAGR